jgi:hypothetical protein
MFLGQAITAVLDGQSQGADASNPADIDDVLTNPDVAALAGKAPSDKSTGDDRDGENADAAATSDSATTKEAAPATGDANKVPTAPKHWPAADQQAFTKLPREGQETILKLAKNLEGGFTRKSQELSDKARFADTVRGLFDESTRAQLRRVGTDEIGAIQYLTKLQTFASQRPAEYVVWAMQNLKVRPEDIGLAPQTQAAGAGAKQPGDKTAQPAQATPQSLTGDPKLDELLKDPAVEQLRSEFAKAQEEINSLKGKMTERERQEHEYAQHVREQQRQAQQTETNNILRLVNEFRTDLDEHGQLAFPLFDTVYQRMGAIMDTVPGIRVMPDGKEKMVAAYHYAVNGDAELSKPAFDARIEAEVSKRVAAASKQAETQRAKRATSIRPAVGAPTQRAKATSLDEAIAGAFTSRGV